MHAQYVDFLHLLEGQMKYIASCWQRHSRRGQADVERPVEPFRPVTRGGPVLAHCGGPFLTYPDLKQLRERTA